MAACDVCGEANSDAARFCSSCGAALPERVREGLEVRKTVTILFCDVVGSTSLGEATDPETTRRVMGRYAQAMTEVIEQHGGTVERFRGDEVMAVFGIPAAHEDDALRAVRAGAAMQRRLAELNAELRATAGVELACRIGINTGEVVAGDPGTGETFVTGDAVNLAKRLEQAAEAGTILIGTATYPLVKDAVKVGPRKRFTAKGKSEPVARLELEHVDATAAGVTRRLDAPLIGRTNELDRIRSLVEATFDEGRCALLTITGAAGIGKSRLVREVAAQLSSGARIAFGRCLPYGSGITYWPLVEVVRDLGGTDAIAERLDVFADDASALDRIRTAIGESDLVVSTDELFLAVRRMLEELARERPLLLCIDDLHWAESTMLDLLEYVAAFGVGPLVILANARPELLETRPGWVAYPVIDLTPLSAAETEELVASLGISDIALRDRIAATAEGNPLFAEQLAAMLAESGASAGERLDLPPSIHALLAARLDSLKPEERRVLERAAVIGKEFWRRAVADLSSDADRAGVGGRLLSLAHKGLVHPVRGDTTQEDTFRFRHALIRDVAYAGMPKRLRADLHESFARWLRSQRVAGFGEHEEIVGYHAEQAYLYRAELGPSDARARALAADAASLLGAAGRRAFARDDMPAAAALLARTAKLLPMGDPTRLEALRDAALASWEAGDAAGGAASLRQLREEATSAGDERMAALAELEDIVHQQQTGTDIDAVKKAAERVIALAAAAQDDASVARAWRRVSAAHRRAGEYAAAESAARDALAHARRAGDGREEARAVDALCNCLLYGETPARDGLAECARLLAEEGRTRTLEASVRGVAAAFNAMLDDIETARAEYGRAASILEELGHELARAALTQVGAPFELLAGDPIAAEHEARKGAEILERFGQASVQAPLIGAALLAQGRQDDAARALHLVEGQTLPTIPQWQVNLRIVQSRLAIAHGHVEDAEEHSEAAVAYANTTEDLNLKADALLARAAAHAFQGRHAQAAADVAAAESLYELKGNVAAVARIEAGAPNGAFELGPSHPSNRGVGSAG